MMKTYGPGITDTIRRVADYQQAHIAYMPGHGPHAHRVVVSGVGDVFEIKDDFDLNKALNKLHKRLYERD